MIIEKFYMDGCAPCYRMNSTFDALEKEYPDILFRHINVYDHKEYAIMNSVRSVPTIIIRKDADTVLSKLTGFQQKADLVNEIKKF